MLKARDVSFSYRSRRGGDVRVLDRVTIEIPRRSIVGLLGPNGAGKTTLIRLLAGMLPAGEGDIRLDETSIAGMSRRELARRIAVVPQETQTVFDFTVMDMVLMGRYPHLGPFALEGPADLEIARQALQATGTAHLETRLFQTLSGGEKQRVAIASALAQASEALLLDEPTAALDLRFQFEIGTLLRRLNEEHGTTMLVSTHDLNFAASVCDRIVLLRDGRVLADGDTSATLTPQNVRRLYDVDADVRFHAEAGHLTVVPIARAH